jgi:tetratricopeptide (TPR) repeat protein
MLDQNQGGQRDAIAQFSPAIPRNAEADYRVYQYRAESYLANGELAKARNDLEDSLRRNPNVAQVHFLLGNVHFKENRLDHALAAYSRALNVVGNNSELKAQILKNRATVQFQMAAFDQAATDYESAVELGQRITKEERYHLGLLLYAAGREARAREAWSGLNATDLKRLKILLDENLSPGF